MCSSDNFETNMFGFEIFIRKYSLATKIFYNFVCGLRQLSPRHNKIRSVFYAKIQKILAFFVPIIKIRRSPLLGAV